MTYVPLQLFFGCNKRLKCELLLHVRTVASAHHNCVQLTHLNYCCFPLPQTMDVPPEKNTTHGRNRGEVQKNKNDHYSWICSFLLRLQSFPTAAYPHVHTFSWIWESSASCKHSHRSKIYPHSGLFTHSSNIPAALWTKTQQRECKTEEKYRYSKSTRWIAFPDGTVTISHDFNYWNSRRLI